MESNDDFDLRAMFEALDHKRSVEGMSWTGVTHAVNQRKPDGRPVATSTILGLRDKPVAEGDGVLQMLLWLERTPENFVPGMKPAKPLPRPKDGQRLRWDTKALFEAMNAKREARNLTWRQVADEIRMVNQSQLTNLAKGGRTGFPKVMRIVRWLGKSSASYMRITDW